jgi:hypothetical protein
MGTSCHPAAARLQSLGSAGDATVASRVERTSWRNKLVHNAPDASLADTVLIAVEDFLRTDAELLILNVHEQTITANLAEHLRRHLPQWDVDCEYNRDGQYVKKANGRRVMPDIIVHRRGTPNNLLVIEVKKSNTRKPDEKDLAKLREFKTGHLKYRYALFLKFSVKPHAPDVQKVQWV